ncbi:uncharacterized protein [Mytilus edulis]|uniref:uncharacterized protein n=1 Tax=Mytilus edulis TaxID=6550 RepID=UPI0039EF4BB6
MSTPTLDLEPDCLKMAASMFRGHGKLLHQICRKHKIFLDAKRRTSTSYIILFPELPPDTEDSNPVMRWKEFPDFPNITHEGVVRAGAKRSIDFEVQLDKHITQLEDVHYQKTFESVFNRIEEILVPLQFTWFTSRQCSSAIFDALTHTEEGFKRAHNRLERQYIKALHERFISTSLVKAVQEVNANSDNLNDAQKRLVDFYLYNLKISGFLMSTNDRRKYYDKVGRRNTHTHNFSKKVRICMDLFEHYVEDVNIIEQLPQSLVYMMADYPEHYEKGPWQVELYDPIYSHFMSHCPCRITRWNIWYAKVNVSSQYHSEQFLNNNETISDVRAQRWGLANKLGYANFAEMVQHRTMAGGVNHVIEVLETIKTVAYPSAQQELATLQDYANNREFFQGELKVWDYAYYKTQREKDIVGLNADGVREYFPAPLVLKGLLDLCSKLFHIQFQENKDVPVWHEDVWVYNILDKDGSYISTFYIDPYNRKGKRKTAWMEPGRLRSFIGTTPFSYMGLNVIPPSHPSEPGYMTFHDVQELFENFGNGLQQMLTTVQYSELSGQYNIEVDAVFTVAKLMRRWLTRPEVLMSISSNPITGKPMSEEMAKKIIEGESSLDAYNMCYDLCKSAFDMECHVHPWMTHWYNIFDKCWNNYMPTPLEGDDFQPNSYTFLFDEQLPAQYYSTVWGEMLAADIFEAFNEVGFEDDVKLGLVGKRFRETFLSLGGSVAGRDVFRKFRGRDPSIQPILEQFKKGQLVEQESATN